MKRRRRSMLLPLAAVLATAPALVSAGPRDATPAGGGLHPWSVPYSPASRETLIDLKGFLATGSGKLLLAQIPTLGFIERLSPDSEAHRRIVGAIGLSSDFESRLRAAVRISDDKALSGAFAAVLDAYHRQNAAERIRAAVSARAEEIDDAFVQGKARLDVLSAAAEELAPFASLSDRAEPDHWRMRRVRQATMDAARRMTTALPDSNVGTRAPDAEEPADRGTLWHRWVREEEGEDQRAAFVAALLERLDRPETRGGAKKIVNRLRETAENANDEGLQRAIAHGLIFEFLKVDRDDYHLHVLDALEKIAIGSPFKNVQAIVMDGVGGHVQAGGNLDLSNRARGAAERIAAVFSGTHDSLIDIAIAQSVDPLDGRLIRLQRLSARAARSPVFPWASLGLMILALAGAVPESLLTATIISLALGYFAFFK